MSEKKTCTKCGEAKPHAQFLRGKRVLTVCRYCTNEQRKNLHTFEFYREKHRKYYAANRERVNERIARYRKANHQKFLAQDAVRRALKRGTLVRPRVCSSCQKEGKIQAHHNDYAKQLQVEWLCVACHVITHRRMSCPK